MNRRPHLPALAFLALAVFSLGPLAPQPAEAGQRFRDGDRVEVTGLVTDTEGRPLPGVRVVLEAARTQFDFKSFRRLMFDRLALTQPDDESQDPATLRAVLVDLLAHAADHLSYFQDAVATEAYLGTARRRPSAG